MVGAAEELASSTSDDAVAVDPEHRVYQPMSTRGPALIVLGIAVFIVVIGIIGSILASKSSAPRLPASVTVAGTAVHLTPATTAMKSIVAGGQPPSDIIGNLVVPASPVVRTLNIDQGVTQFDRTVYFSTRLSTDKIIDVYRSVLPGLGWTVTYHGPQTNGLGTELLAKRGSADGFYWEVGVVASPTTSAGTTPFSVEVLEMSDDT